MESHGDEQRKCYYSVLGLRNDAPACAIRGAYLKLAMEWHPDKCNSQDGAKAKVKFQEIQEAYAVLSDENKKFLYDNGLYDPEDDEEDIVESTGGGSNVEELQQLFESMFSGDLASFSNRKSSL